MQSILLPSCPSYLASVPPCVPIPYASYASPLPLLHPSYVPYVSYIYSILYSLPLFNPMCPNTPVLNG